MSLSLPFEHRSDGTTARTSYTNSGPEIIPSFLVLGDSGNERIREWHWAAS